MSDSILLAIGNDRSLCAVFTTSEGLPCGFTKTLTWLSIRYDCRVFSFNGYLKMLILAIVDEKYLTFSRSKEPNFIFRFLAKSYTSLFFSISGILLRQSYRATCYYVIALTSQTSKPPRAGCRDSQPKGCGVRPAA